MARTVGRQAERNTRAGPAHHACWSPPPHARRPLPDHRRRLPSRPRSSASSTRCGAWLAGWLGGRPRALLVCGDRTALSMMRLLTSYLRLLHCCCLCTGRLQRRVSRQVQPRPRADRGGGGLWCGSAAGRQLTGRQQHRCTDGGWVLACGRGRARPHTPARPPTARQQQFDTSQRCPACSSHSITI